MTQNKSRRLQTLVVTLLVIAGLLVAISSVLALNSMLKTFHDVYPNSATGDAGCSTCHGSSTNNLNAYGRDLCISFNGSIPADITSDLQTIGSWDSDGDGNNNLVEINANAQPGWTVGPNPLYYGLDLGCAPTGASITVPADVPLPYDPPEGGDPVAVPGGPYTGYVDVPVTFDGSDSYDSDGSDIASYAWDFGDGTTGTGLTTQHTYAAADTYVVTLTVEDGEGNSDTNSTTATILAESVLDLDIAKLDVPRTSRLGKDISVKLQVNNDGPILGQAIATIVGVDGEGDEVYRWRLNVYDYPGKKATSFTFPAYTPKAKGTITWTATIADVDPDVDEATATTTVK